MLAGRLVVVKLKTKVLVKMLLAARMLLASRLAVVMLKTKLLAKMLPAVRMLLASRLLVVMSKETKLPATKLPVAQLRVMLSIH
jgi:hypothetical protein